MRAALFDMDRTLVSRETASLWMRYQRDIGKASMLDALRVSYWVLKYTFGVLKAEETAERLVRTLEGTREDEFIARCEDWFARYVEQHISARGRETVQAHKASGDIIAIVTGATPYAARPLGKRLGIEHVVASELEVGDDGRFTGRARKPFCYGEGKVSLSVALAKKIGFSLEDATFYTDSLTDLPLLERVKDPVVVNPDPRLRRVAKRRGWRIERW